MKASMTRVNLHHAVITRPIPIHRQCNNIMAPGTTTQLPIRPNSTDESCQKKGVKRSYYDVDVDFAELAEQDPDFAAISKVSKERRFVDYQNPAVVQ